MQKLVIITYFPYYTRQKYLIAYTSFVCHSTHLTINDKARKTATKIKTFYNVEMKVAP